tara:strand:- start:2551 stop:2724 length:174 start_codon:yes stop_codon:yes gene_type:complete
MPKGKGTYGTTKGRPPKKMMGGGAPKYMSRGGKLAKIERKASGGMMSIPKEVFDKIK